MTPRRVAQAVREYVANHSRGTLAADCPQSQRTCRPSVSGNRAVGGGPHRCVYPGGARGGLAQRNDCGRSGGTLQPSRPGSGQHRSWPRPQTQKCIRARRVSGQDSDGRCLHELLSGHAARLALARYRRADKPTDQAKDTMKVGKSMGKTCAWRHLEHSHCQKRTPHHYRLRTRFQWHVSVIGVQSSELISPRQAPPTHTQTDSRIPNPWARRRLPDAIPEHSTPE
jgi:hypothetical protein